MDKNNKEDEDVNNVEQKRRRYRHDGSAIDTCTSCKRNSDYIERLCLEGAGSEKDIEGEKCGAGSEKIVALEAEDSVAKVATKKEFCHSKCGSCSECATAQEAEKGEGAKDDKVAETATTKATEKGKVENEAQLATSPRMRSIVKRFKEKRDQKEKKLEDYEVGDLPSASLELHENKGSTETATNHKNTISAKFTKSLLSSVHTSKTSTLN
ncbi:hypothetical protein ACLB2K_053046 [Fragaria x ananassa]